MDDNEELTKIVRDILLVEWDPIRIQELPVEFHTSNQDEYDRYVKIVSEMIVDGKDQIALENYLFDVETQTMRQKPHNSRAAAAARALFGLEKKFSSHN